MSCGTPSLAAVPPTPYRLRGALFSALNENYQGLKLQTKTVADFRNLQNLLVTQKFALHTYSLKEEREIRVVLRGVPRELSIEEVKEDLLSQNLPVQSVHRTVAQELKPALSRFNRFLMPGRIHGTQSVPFVIYPRLLIAFIDTLIRKLHHYGVTGRSLALLESYLRGRIQKVDVNASCRLTCYVPADGTHFTDTCAQVEEGTSAYVHSSSISLLASADYACPWAAMTTYFLSWAARTILPFDNSKKKQSLATPNPHWANV
ncbi:hypothetical protein EVAR_32375_1 [Eumeta japonica]|uniref:Uncharacterized protein n=1 Tax=Eumeta variegata TaxID=151549 RepID=A0A4C1VJT5_EUMVA|nr:hypothetical protein EVAR_32375_1 [Eumeta japonica]